MHTQNTKQTLASLSIETLLPHPANPNRMSRTAMNKLTRQIEQTGQYEPIVVRRHPQKTGAYQILNGHHRVRILKRLDHTHADCVIFRADEAEALVYLATLNHLKGRSNVRNKSRLIEQLCRHRSSKQLGRLLPDSQTAIDKLNALAQQKPAVEIEPPKPLLNPLTFFVTDAQKQLIEAAFSKALVHDNQSQSRTQKRLQALCRLAERYLADDPATQTSASAAKTH